MKNEIKVKQKPEKEVSNKKPSRFVSIFQSIIDGTFLTRENLIRQIPFVFYLVFLAVGYIANNYYTEKIVREIDKTKNELKEFRSEYITIKSELMNKSKQSEVVKKTELFGIKESLDPPKKIISEK